MRRGGKRSASTSVATAIERGEIAEPDNAPSPPRERKQRLASAAFPRYARGSLRPAVPITPEGVADLVRLGWLDRRACRAPAPIAAAVADLASIALVAGLRWDDGRLARA